MDDESTSRRSALKGIAVSLGLASLPWSGLARAAHDAHAAAQAPATATYKLLSAMPLDFIKVDGALVQDLAGNPETQIVVKKLVEQAVKLKVETIAERVEDANTMAVLWQLGVQFIQGYFVNAPEEVVMAEGSQARR